MDTLYIILITLITYSFISTIAYIISKENDDVAIWFGLGVVGLILAGTAKIFHKIRNLFKYHIGKRSIFMEESTGNKYKCKTKDTNDINHWTSGYKLVERYASKTEWSELPDFNKEFIEKSKRNCNHCKYDKECRRGKQHVKCKHDEYGTVLEFDEFIKK